MMESTRRIYTPDDIGRCIGERIAAIYASEFVWIAAAIIADKRITDGIVEAVSL